jgi:hypothetical protein
MKHAGVIADEKIALQKRSRKGTEISRRKHEWPESRMRREICRQVSFRVSPAHKHLRLQFLVNPSGKLAEACGRPSVLWLSCADMEGDDRFPPVDPKPGKLSSGVFLFSLREVHRLRPVPGIGSNVSNDVQIPVGLVPERGRVRCPKVIEEILLHASKGAMF